VLSEWSEIAKSYKKCNPKQRILESIYMSSFFKDTLRFRPVPKKKKINTELFIDGTAALSILEIRIRKDQTEESTGETSLLEKRVCLALKRIGNERSGSSLSQNGNIT